LNNTFPWLASIVWEDHSQNRLPFNPYWALDMYAEADKGFSSLYSLKNKAPIKTFLQSVEKNESIGHRIAFGGVVVQRIHLVHASDEWTLDYDNASEDLKTEINGMMMLTPLYRQIIDNIIQNKQPLLQLNIRTTNETLLIKSVIGHIVILHSSIPADSSPLTVYLNNIQNCHMYYILTVQTEQLKLTRYLCQCGYKYFIVNCGQAIEANKCPQCKSNTIEGASQNVTVMDESNNVDYSVRTMPPNAYRILHLIVHALIGSSNSAKDFLKQIASNIEEYCFRHIQNDWKVLKNIFNCNDENLALLLHSILTEMSKKLFTGGPLIITTPAQQDEWELQFTKDYVEPQTKSFNESVTNFHRKLDAGLKRANGNANIIESEINQTIDMDNNYKVEYLPNLWRTIGTISFESFRAYYLADQINNNKTYPFLSIFFKHSEKLSQVKHLFPIIKFAEILASRLVYRINRKDTHNKSFQEFINDESNGGIVKETHETLAKAFGEFSEAFKVRDKTGKTYVIKKAKRPFKNLCDRQDKLEEVEILWKLGKHSNCLELISAWEQEGYLYLQTEYCEHGTLKIGDFGLATHWPVRMGFDKEGDRVYLAGEILSESRNDKPADIFSFGLIILELSTKLDNQQLNNSSIAQILLYKSKKKPYPLEKINPRDEVHIKS
ncbi:9039_t:CDS:2, partial [Entrophospora sp. SA101]